MLRIYIMITILIKMTAYASAFIFSHIIEKTKLLDLYHLKYLIFNLTA